MKVFIISACVIGHERAAEAGEIVDVSSDVAGVLAAAGRCRAVTDADTEADKKSESSKPKK